MVEEQLLPIDIHSTKLLDWLINRRHCSKDWQKAVLVIREKISHAIQDMPEDERIVQLLQGAYINYFHCIRIVEILKETEKDTKNFLGYYSSQRMNDWLQIQQLYEKENVNLAEAAQTLQRLVQYEIPALKKQITKCDQTVADCMKKEEEYIKQSVDGKKQFQGELQKFGIKGQHLRRELMLLAADLPSFFNEVANEILQLREPLHYYENFRKYLHQTNEPKSILLPLCSLIINEGVDTTVFEWKRGKKPTAVERPPFDSLVYEDNEKNELDDTIDFGDGDISGGIDFGPSEAAEVDFGGLDGIQIEVVADDHGELDDGIAHGDEALTLLENAQSQKLILSELAELEAFLTFRRSDEMRESASDIYISGMEERPAHIRAVEVSQMGAWIMHIREIITKLSDPHKALLFKIRSSPQYVEKLVEKLEQKRSLEGRYERMRKLMIERIAEAQEAAAKAQTDLKHVSDSTRVLQKQIEEEISKKYKGRTVNIMGGINAALMAS
uniref:CDK5RAP3-like protein n=2 Tax=Parascaris univalens TaxID=6257 RepID=A0A915BV85_PARUN